MTVADLTLWGHALAALLFGALAVSELRGGAGLLPRATFIAALAATGLWALAIAGIDARNVSARVAESVRTLAWLGFMYALLRHGRARGPGLAVSATYLAVAAVSVAAAALAVYESGLVTGPLVATVTGARLLLRMMVAVSALVLLQQLHTQVVPSARGGIRLAVAALAVLWSADFVLYTSAWLGGGWPGGVVAARGLVMVVLAPLFAVAVHRNGDWTLQLSRTVAFQSLSLAALALYIVAMVLVGGLLAAVGGTHARIWQTAFIAGSTASILTVVASPWLRAWVKVKVTKHLFSHRYDYRHEWTRFTATLGRAGEHGAALDERVVKAIANLIDAPGGLLLVPEGETLQGAAAWNWPDPAPTVAADLARTLESGRIVELDQDPAFAASPNAWALVPLIHQGRLSGAVLLARPPLVRALDWEDFDLLRVAGSQGAAHLAEASALAALAEAQRFDEFNRRFAFIIHDIKNLVSQLTLVARNAERHADNPAFRADMVATLNDSCGRMNELLARLSQHHGGRADPVGPALLLPLVERVAARRRAQHPVSVSGDGTALALVDPVRFEQLVAHLLQNAIEASASAAPVTLTVGAEGDGVTVVVTDQGVGMSPAFIRDELFRPFASSKPGGFGIGAFEARQLAEGMGGRIEVVSREGAGTRFTVSLPRVAALRVAA